MTLLFGRIILTLSWFDLFSNSVDADSKVWNGILDPNGPLHRAKRSPACLHRVRNRENSVTNPVVTPPAKVQFPVEVIGADVFGQQFFELTRTVSIHRNGVSILLSNQLAPDTEVIVRNPQTSQEAPAFLVGQIRGKREDEFIYGLAFLNPASDLWNVQFPGTSEEKTVQLECADCHSVSSVSISDIELEIFEESRELIRFCDDCNASRTWHESGREAVEKKPKTLTIPDPTDELIASRAAERRKNRRTSMKTSACLRFSGMEFVVPCEDISKGGFRFTSRKEFARGTRVEAAVPYTKSSTNIFCQASIIYCHEMPDGQFRHGVTYIKSR